MEEACKNLIYGNYEETVTIITKLIETTLNTSELFLYRGIAHLQLNKPDFALPDLEKSNTMKPKNFQTILHKGIALFRQDKYNDALNDFKEADPLATETFEQIAVTSWIQKCLREQGNSSANKLNQSAVMPMTSRYGVEEAKKGLPDYDWYQNATHVDVAVKVKGVSKPHLTVSFGAQEVEVSIKLNETDVKEFSYKLEREIVPEECSYTIDEKKIEMKLKKKDNGLQWNNFQKVQEKVEFKPVYPSSSKKKKDWSKLDKEMEKEVAKNKPDGDDALNNLFKAIYEKADENTRRAMIKSFQTSGGTVLSTNWKEVQDKDYEGKDRPEPPKGQQWVKPDL